MKFIGAIFATLIALFTTPVFATDAQNSVRMQLSPTSERITLEAGSTYQNTFMLRNLGTNEFHYSLGASPYQVTDDSYLPNYNISNTYTKIVDWITFDHQKGVLGAGESINITYTINVPNDVPAGGQYAILTAETSDGNISGTSVRTISRLGMVLYATVSGNTRSSGNIVESKIPAFIFNSKLYATSTVINTGNIDAEAVYTMTVRNMLNNELAYSNMSDPVIKIVLPDTTRTNVLVWEGSPAVGLFRVEQNVEFLGHVDNISKVVFLCPVWLLVVFIIFVIFAIIKIVMTVRAKQERIKRGKFGL